IVPEDKLNVGEVWETKDFHWTLPVENKSRDTIEIVAFHSSCNCLSIEPSHVSIGPGQAIDVQLKIDLMRASRAGDGNPVHEFEVQLAPQIAGQALATSGWTLRGL